MSVDLAAMEERAKRALQYWTPRFPQKAQPRVERPQDIASDVLTLAEELRRLREVTRENVGDAYNLMTQGESPNQRRQPAAQRIYARSKSALSREPAEEAK